MHESIAHLAGNLMATTHEEQWWKDAVVYQVYPRSFADSNSDGIGDIQGIRSRMNYIATLGVDALWLSPHYPSPMLDAGYDVSNYRDVEPVFGSLSDIKGLIDDLHGNGIRLLIDIVPNHTSWDHDWFKEALTQIPKNDSGVKALTRYSEGAWSRYHLLRGREGGSIAPNEWPSVFGGLAWHELKDAKGVGTGWWYLHIFDKSQPDLDWTNQEVRTEFLGHLRFWFDLGVDGFRIDVAHGLAKAIDYPDFKTPGPDDPSNQVPYWDQDPVHEIWREWRAVAKDYLPERVFVAEAWVSPAPRNALYLREDELHTGFNFPFLTAKWDAETLKEVIDESLMGNASVNAPTTWVLENHDVIRTPTRYAPILGEVAFQEENSELNLSGPTDWRTPRNLEIGRKRARAGLLNMLALPGSAYIYQGQELGLEEVLSIPDHLRQDPAFVTSGGEHLGRDGCRVPLPWDANSSSLGFNDSDALWLPQPEHWAELTADNQVSDVESVLSLTTRALALRKNLGALGGIVDGVAPLIWDKAASGLLSYIRPARLNGPAIRCVVNMSESWLPIPDGKVLIESETGCVVDGKIASNSSVWLQI